jgi:hypothetical protein
MKRLLLLATFCLSLTVLLRAEGNPPLPLPNGATAPDFTLTDVNGVTHTLYDYLDQGYTVFLEFSAVWCGPCWNYHNSGILEEIYNTYGPNGTDQVMVFFIEGDPSTPESLLFGGPGSQGNWVAGTPFPIMDDPNGAVTASYAITYYPTLYSVCPNKKIYEAGQTSVAGWETRLQSCSLAETHTSTDLTCFGENTGSIDLMPTGGYGGLSYQWSNGMNTQDLTGLPGGAYTCTISDVYGHSVEAGPIVISSPPPFNTQLVNQQAPLCFAQNSGSISVSANGGTPGYEYAWNTGATGPFVNNLLGGTYTVTATDDNGCESQLSVNLVEPLPVTANLIIGDENCEQGDGSIIVQANGGSFAYTYDIGFGSQASPLFSGLESGTYNVSVTDFNGCTNIAPIVAEVGEDAGPVADAGPEQTLNCLASELELDGSNSEQGNNISYQWTTADGNIVEGATTLDPLVDAPGTYILEVTDNATGCAETSSVLVEEILDIPEAVAATPGELTCSQAELDLDATGSSQGNDIQIVWTTDDGNIVAGDSTYTPTVDAAGTYRATVTNLLSGCTNEVDVEVTADQDLPEVVIASPEDLTCVILELDLDGSGSSGGSNIEYLWETTDGNIVAGSTEAIATIDAPGTYTLTLTNNENDCVEASSIEVLEDVAAPIADAGVEETLNCNVSSVTLDGSNSSSGSNFEYLWTTADGNIVSGATTLSPTVDAAGTYSLEVTNQDNGCVSNDATLVGETPPVEIELDTQADVLCAGGANGSATVSAGSGTAPYSFLWSNGETSETATGLAAGSYSVTATDADGCTDVLSVSIAEPDPLTGNTSATAETSNGANDGTATAAPTGGTGPYSYSWSNGETTETISDLQPGTYTVTVMDVNGCTTIETATVNSFACGVVALVEGVNVSCNGAGNGQATLSLENFLPPLDLEWSNGETTLVITDLSPGTYSVTLTDGNNCPASGNITISEPPVLGVELVDMIPVDCAGSNTGSATVEANGGNGTYSYLWPDGTTEATAIDLAAGTYEVQVFDQNDCASSLAVTVTEPSAIQVATEVEHESAFGANDGEATANPTGGTPGYTYAWDNGADTETITGLAPGTYTVTVMDANGCESVQTITIEAYVCPSIDLVVDVQEVSCAGDANGAAEVIITGGNDPYTIDWSTGDQAPSVENLAPGDYEVSIVDGFNCAVSTTFSVEEPDPVAVQLNALEDVSCPGGANGSLTVAAEGGTAPFTYEWSNGATGAQVTDLTAGAYTVTATDVNGCQETLEATIEEVPDTEAPTLVVEDISVQLDENGEASITPSALDMGSFDNCAITEWALSQSSFSCDDLGPQTVTISAFDASGNQSEKQVTITVEDNQFPVMECPEDIVALNCDGLVEYDLPIFTDNCAADLTQTAGLGSGSNFPLGVTTEEYTVTDAAGNSATCSFQITIENTMELSAEATGSCPDEATGTIVTDVTGGTPGYTYTWDQGLEGPNPTEVPAGTYALTVTDETGCVQETEVTVEGFPEVEFEIDEIFNANQGASNGAVLVTVGGGTPPFVFEWTNEDNEVVSVLQNLTGVPAGTYVCTITDSNGCVWVSDPIVISTISNVAELTSEALLRVYPNPADDQLFVDLELAGQPQEAVFELFNAGGQQVWSKEAAAQRDHHFRAELGNLPAGLYYLRIQIGGQQIRVEKVVIH